LRDVFNVDAVFCNLARTSYKRFNPLIENDLAHPGRHPRHA